MAGRRGPRGPPIGGMRPGTGGGADLDGLSQGTRLRLARGALAGTVATAVFSLSLLASLEKGLLSLPEMPAFVLAAQLLGGLGGALLVGVVAVTFQVAYGAFWGAVLALARDPVRPVHGLGLGTALWVLEQTLVLPMIGWGLFSQALASPWQAAGLSLGLHLVYGLAAASLLAWHEHQGPEPPPS